MRRWNGWGDESVVYELPPYAAEYLEERLGAGEAGRDAGLGDVRPPASRLAEHPLISEDPETRVRHARGGSFGDLVALRSGRIGAFPDGVATPTSEEEVGELLRYARRTGCRIIPWGGGTSVVGGVNPEPGDSPVLTVSLGRTFRLLDMDEESRLATFGAGVRGPWVEAQLRARGYTLGHYPQSFEYSTLGGWISARSSGQQSLGYGRIEDLFAGGRVLTPEGPLDLPPFPASAAGPDLRQLVLGHEGRLGVITEATVHVRPLPERERFWGVAFPDWEAGVAAIRELAREPQALSMVRLSDPEETRSQLRLALNPYVRRPLEALLARRGLGDEKCLLILAATGSSVAVRRTHAATRALTQAHGGVPLGDVAGKQWRNRRFRLPYLRNTLWENGWATDTLETATTWSGLLPTAQAVLEALRGALDGEPVLAMTHVSHVYPTGASLYFTFFFRRPADPDTTLHRWQTLKNAALGAIVKRGATITHHHGVGTDHLPWMRGEKGSTGTAMLRALVGSVDPEATMNPGKLLP